MAVLPSRKSVERDRIWHVSPSENLLSILHGMDEEQMLSGPWRDSGEAEIDDIFASNFSTALRDLRMDAKISPAKGVLDQALGTPLCAFATDLWKNGEVLMESPEDELRIVACDFGVLLLQLRPDQEHARISGMFWGQTLIMDPVSNLRGNGYGRDLVMARMILDDALPTWDLDTPSYSDPGAACVRSACRRLSTYVHDIAREPS